MDLAELKDLAIKYDVIKADRLAADKYSQQLKSQEDALKQQIIAHCKLEKKQGIDLAGVFIDYTTKEHPFATDWPLIHTFMREHNAMDLMQKRLHEGACKERWADSVEIPGVGHVEQDILKVKVTL
jgi:hypothetical protein